MSKIVDQFGREIAPLKRPDKEPIYVASIRDRWSTYPSQGLTPQRLALILKEADAGDVMRQSELFEEMEEKDAHLASVLQTRKNAVLGLEWKIEPASDEAQDIKIAEFCDETLSGLKKFNEGLLDLRRRNRTKVHPMTAGYNGGQQLRLVFSQQDYRHIRRRLFQSLEETVG